MKLTDPQKRHLVEMLAANGRDSLYWHPWGSGERRCATTLERKGLLASTYEAYRGRVYSLTAEGIAVAQGLPRLVVAT